MVVKFQDVIMNSLRTDAAHQCKVNGQFMPEIRLNILNTLLNIKMHVMQTLFVFGQNIITRSL